LYLKTPEGMQHWQHNTCEKGKLRYVPT
jgi:hypothetical protein